MTRETPHRLVTIGTGQQRIRWDSDPFAASRPTALANGRRPRGVITVRSG
jgi:hypothetical protein